MKFFLTIALFVLADTILMAQLVPSTNQSFQLIQSFNPAFVGVDNFSSLKIGYRNQWVSFPGAPQYLNLVFSTRLKQPTDVVHNALKTGQSYGPGQLPAGRRAIQGLGLNLTREKYGVIENIDIGVSYSYQIPFSDKIYFSAGLAPSYSNARIQVDRLSTKDPDRFLEYLQSSSTSNSIFNIRTGVALYSPSFYLHFAYLQTWSHVIDENISPIGYNYIASAGAGVSTNIGPSTKLKPSVFLLMDEQHNELVLDYSVKAYFGSQIWGGLMYRSTGFGSVILGFELNTTIGASYSYEISTGGLRGFQNGSHELVLGLKLNNLRKLTPYVW